jgi:hypothetical protein
MWGLTCRLGPSSRLLVGKTADLFKVTVMVLYSYMYRGVCKALIARFARRRYRFDLVMESLNDTASWLQFLVCTRFERAADASQLE